jgi:hypothetical protein
MSVNNILETYIKASEQDLIEGMSWYENANSFCKRLSVTYQFPVVKVAAVVSLLSPRNRWEKNKVDAENLFLAYRNGENPHHVKVSTFNGNRSKAVAIILGKEDMIMPNGPKTKAFFKNIMGSSDTVTIDTHAYSIACGERKIAPTISRPLYRKIEAQYIETADLLGIKPYQVQACTWVTFRRINKI